MRFTEDEWVDLVDTLIGAGLDIGLAGDYGQVEGIELNQEATVLTPRQVEMMRFVWD